MSGIRVNEIQNKGSVIKKSPIYTNFSKYFTATLDVNDGVVIDLSVPKVSFIQESFVLADMTDDTTTGATIELSTELPIGAIVTQSFITGVTGFIGDTSAVITIGDGTDEDRYNTGTPSVFTTATDVSAGEVSGTAFHAVAKTPTITITAATEWGDVTAGGCTITIAYYEVH